MAERNNIENGSTEPVYVQVNDAEGNGLTGIANDIDYAFIKDGGDTWNGTTFTAPATTVNPTEVSSGSAPGLYKYDFTPDEDDITVTVYITSTNASVVNLPAVDHIEVGGSKEGRILKWLKNKLTIVGGTYTLYDDDEVTSIASGTTTAPDGSRDPA